MEIVAAILAKAVAIIVGSLLGVIIAIVCMSIVSSRRQKKKILNAIKTLDLEDELSRCPFGCNAELHRKITAHSQCYINALSLTMIINELRSEGKIKPMAPKEELQKVIDELNRRANSRAKVA